MRRCKELLEESRIPAEQKDGIRTDNYKQSLPASGV
jgi:hypothetical protein